MLSNAMALSILFSVAVVNGMNGYESACELPFYQNLVSSGDKA